MCVKGVRSVEVGRPGLRQEKGREAPWQSEGHCPGASEPGSVAVGASALPSVSSAASQAISKCLKWVLSKLALLNLQVKTANAREITSGAHSEYFKKYKYKTPANARVSCVTGQTLFHNIPPSVMGL